MRRLVFVFMLLVVATPVLAVGYWSNLGFGSRTELEDVQVLLDAGRYEDAIKALKPILADDADNADALNLMGYALRKSGDVTNALDFYLKALAISPEHLGANEYLGELYVETGDFTKATERLTILETACGVECDQYLELKALIEASQL